MTPERKRAAIATVLLLGAALGIAVALYLAERSRPEIASKTSITSAALGPRTEVCPVRASPYFRGAPTSGVLDDPLTLDRISRCLKADRSAQIALDDVTTVPRAQQVSGGLEQRGVLASDLARVTFGNGLRLCSSRDLDCWTKRTDQLNGVDATAP
jgi:hypothetical protein